MEPLKAVALIRSIKHTLECGSLEDFNILERFGVEPSQQYFDEAVKAGNMAIVNAWPQFHIYASDAILSGKLELYLRSVDKDDDSTHGEDDNAILVEVAKSRSMEILEYLKPNIYGIPREFIKYNFFDGIVALSGNPGFIEDQVFNVAIAIEEKRWLILELLLSIIPDKNDFIANMDLVGFSDIPREAQILFKNYGL